jgi:hypothetical protein
MVCAAPVCVTPIDVGQWANLKKRRTPLSETYDEQLERQWLDAATRLTEKQLHTAIEVCTRVMGDGAPPPEPALLSGVVQALAINLSTVRRKR